VETRINTFPFLIFIIAVFIATVTHARPSPDRLAICYTFNNDDLLKKIPCIISSGYGAGGSYTQLAIGQTSIQIEDDDGQKHPKGPMLNGKKARAYNRDGYFYQSVDKNVHRDKNEADNDLFCFNEIGQAASYCYK
jgi:hypothetical protein